LVIIARTSFFPLQEAKNDVSRALVQFRKSGKIPEIVMKTSIFRKEYFASEFIPALMLRKKNREEARSME
jgi:hypothetical protein